VVFIKPWKAKEKSRNIIIHTGVAASGLDFNQCNKNVNQPSSGGGTISGLHLCAAAAAAVYYIKWERECCAVLNS
jgi:hypothetical protein